MDSGISKRHRLSAWGPGRLIIVNHMCKLALTNGGSSLPPMVQRPTPSSTPLPAGQSTTWFVYILHRRRVHVIPICYLAAQCDKVDQRELSMSGNPTYMGNLLLWIELDFRTSDWLSHRTRLCLSLGSSLLSVCSLCYAKPFSMLKELGLTTGLGGDQLGSVFLISFLKKSSSIWINA